MAMIGRAAKKNPRQIERNIALSKIAKNFESYTILEYIESCSVHVKLDSILRIDDVPESDEEEDESD